MSLYSIIYSLCFLLLFTPTAYSANCSLTPDIRPEYKEASEFIKNSVYALHLQLTNEDFSSASATLSRAKLFDMIINTPYWSRKFNKPDEFKTFWNWIRFQYWGLIQQQGLLREDQGFKITQDKSLKQSFSKILKFPVYPYPISITTLSCDPSEKLTYPCERSILKVEVLLSPSLACDKALDLDNFTFQYLLTQDNDNLSVLDIKFKGRSLISDSFLAQDNLINRLGNEKALEYTKLLINKQSVIEPNLRIENSGSSAFYRNFKIKAPKYPLSY